MLYCTVLYCTVSCSVQCALCHTLCSEAEKEERRKQIFRCGLSWSTLTTLSLESTSTTLHTTLHRTIIGLQAQLPTILIFIFNPLHHPTSPALLWATSIFSLTHCYIGIYTSYPLPTLTLPYCHIATHLGFISTSHPLRDQWLGGKECRSRTDSEHWV